MTKINVPYISPIRFRPQSSMTWPNLDKMTHRTDYQRGIKSSNFMPDWLIDSEIVIQAETDQPYSLTYNPFNFRVVKPDGSTSLMTREAAFTGPTTNYIFNFSFTPTMEGEHYIYSVDFPLLDYVVISDIFYVRSNDSDLVKIEYNDTLNRFGGYFDDTNPYGIYDFWRPYIYMTGHVSPGEPKNEYTILKDDPGTPVKLNAEPQDTIQLRLTDISQLELRRLNYIFSCDTIKVNGMPVINEEIMEVEKIEKSDLMNISINLTLTENDYYIKNL